MGRHLPALVVFRQNLQVDRITSMEQDQQIAALVVAQKTHGAFSPFF